MSEDKSPVQLIIWVVIVAGALLKPVLEGFLKRQQERRRPKELPRRAPPPPPEEPEEGGSVLPYEDLAQEVFGPYIARRRREARRAPPPPPEGPPAPAPEPPAAEPEAPASVPVAEAPPAGVRGADRRSLPDAPPLAPLARRRSIEDRIFGRRPLGPAARLFLASEIFQPPRLLRGRRAPGAK